MNISSSVDQAAIYGQITPTNLGKKPNSPINESARSADAKLEQDNKSNQQTSPSIVIDEQAISLFKENQASQSPLTTANDDSSAFASQDQPTPRNETAVAQYQTIGNLPERESIQKLFGVDLIA